MSTSTETSKSSFSQEPMVTGKLRQFFHPTLSRTTVLWESLMANQTAANVLVLNATAAQSQCHSVKLTKLILVVMIAKLMGHGKRVFTPEFTEMLRSFKQ